MVYLGRRQGSGELQQVVRSGADFKILSAIQVHAAARREVRRVDRPRAEAPAGWQARRRGSGGEGHQQRQRAGSGFCGCHASLPQRHDGTPRNVERDVVRNPCLFMPATNRSRYRSRDSTWALSLDALLTAPLHQSPGDQDVRLHPAGLPA